MYTALTEHCEKKKNSFYLVVDTMKEILTAQNRFRNNLLLVLKSAPTFNYYALCSSVSLTEIWHFSCNLFK